MFIFNIYFLYINNITTKIYDIYDVTLLGTNTFFNLLLYFLFSIFAAIDALEGSVYNAPSY